jgi:hypothetical protein
LQIRTLLVHIFRAGIGMKHPFQIGEGANEVLRELIFRFTAKKG